MIGMGPQLRGKRCVGEGRDEKGGQGTFLSTVYAERALPTLSAETTDRKNSQIAKKEQKRVHLFLRERVGAVLFVLFAGLSSGKTRVGSGIQDGHLVVTALSKG